MPKMFKKSLNFGNPNKFPHIVQNLSRLCSLAIEFVGFRACRVFLGLKVYWVIRA
jgi:hypothetical protein